MPRQFVETQRVTSKYDKFGRKVETVVNTIYPSNHRSATDERRKKQEVISQLQAMVARYEIGPEFANFLANIVKDYKRNPRWKHTPKPRNLIEHGDADWKFKKSAETDKNEIRLLSSMSKHPEDYALTEDGQEKIRVKYQERIALFASHYPKEALKYRATAECIAYNKNTRRRWYEDFTKCGWSDKITDDEIKKVLEKELKNANPNGWSQF